MLAASFIAGLKRRHKRLRLFFILLNRKDRSPHRIALGFAIGLFASLSPFLGFHALIAVVLSFVFRANKFVALAATLINNPLTMIPIYLGSYGLGMLFLPKAEAKAEPFRELLRNADWSTFVHLGNSILIPLLLGYVVAGTALATLSYFAVRALSRRYQERRRKIIGLHRPS